LLAQVSSAPASVQIKLMRVAELLQEVIQPWWRNRQAGFAASVKIGDPEDPPSLSQLLLNRLVASVGLQGEPVQNSWCTAARFFLF
jgi:hypothetical protein